MNESLEQIKGYLKAFEAVNGGNYEGTDYLVDEIEFNGDKVIAIENYLMSRFKSDKKPESLSFNKINNWR